MKPSEQRPTASSPLRVAVIGAGLIGRQRARALMSLSDVELVATVDPVADPPVDAAAPHFASLGEIPTDSYDAAVVAVPHDLAVPLAAQVMESGRPVLVEKPLGTTGAEARHLERLGNAVAMPSFVGYNYRFIPSVSRLLVCVGSGDLGRLRTLDLLVGHGGHPGSADGWKLDPARAGGGVLLDPGVHLLDLLLAIAPDAVCVSIEATRGFWGTGIEEDVVATFRDEALIATVRVSHVRWINTFRIEAFGEEGYAIAEGRGGNYGPIIFRRGRRWAWRTPGVASQRESEEVEEFGNHDPSLHDEIAAVAAAWGSGHTPETVPAPADLERGRRVTELCESLYPRIGGRGDT
jgi:predicted dehydrogenase